MSESSPVAVVDRHIGDRRVDRKVENRHHLSAGQDWIKQLAFDVKNVSKKNITFINIDLLVPKTGAMERGMVLSLSFGQRTPTTPANPGIVLPGDVVTIRLDDPERTSFEKYIQKYDADNIERVTMQVREVHFDDGTGWIGGREFRRVVSDNPSSRGQPKIPWATLMPTTLSSFLGVKLWFSIPAGCRNFFAPMPRFAPPPPDCGYIRINETLELCRTTCTDSGENTDCKQLPNDTLAGSPPDALGYILPSEQTTCVRTTPGTCGTCPLSTRDIGQQDPLCGQAHGCGQTSAWGCQSGFVEVGGVCVRSQQWITDNCTSQAGYDGSTCSCIPCNPLPGACTPPGQIINCQCVGAPDSPIVVDVSGNGFNLTSLENGVTFDLNGDGVAEQLSWTASQSDDAWLALDRNNNAAIDKGSELFGNHTSQPPPPQGEERNGFLALAQFDLSGNGGNEDGEITVSDAVFASLKLWTDLNHNGVSEQDELKSLGAMGLKSIDLKYKKSKKTDQHGNEFRYRAKVKDAHGAQLGRWAWDVYLLRE